MRPLELASRYMQAFFGESTLESMVPLLAEDLSFSGPWLQCSSAQTYFDALRAAPPTGANYEILERYETDDSACLIYRFSKPGVETLMAQTFEVRAEKIAGIRLIFDTNAFA